MAMDGDSSGQVNGHGVESDGLALQDFGVHLLLDSNGERWLDVKYRIRAPGDTNMRDANEINAKIEATIFRYFDETPPKSRKARQAALRKAERAAQAQLPTPDLKPSHWNGEPVAASCGIGP
jgi:hypothetical protein